MFENDRRPDVPTVVGFVVILLLAGGVILAAAGGIAGQSPLLGSAGDDSIEAGLTAAENETETPADSSPTTASTQDETSPSTADDDQSIDTPGDSESSSDDGGEAESVTETETATQTATEADTSDGSSGPGGSGNSGESSSSSSSSSSSDDSTDSSESSGDGEDTETETSEDPDGDTDTETPTDTPEPDEPDGDLGLFECDDDDGESCEIRLTEPPSISQPSQEYDMPVIDLYAHWVLSQPGVLGMQFQDDGDRTLVLVFHGGPPPDLPSHGDEGVETREILTDGMPTRGPPPEGYEWEPLPDRSYTYNLEISDGAARTMLTHDDVQGVKAGLDGGVVFYVTSEEFAEEAPDEIEGRSIEYVVVEPVSAPDQ